MWCNMVERAPICCFKPSKLTPEEAKKKLSLSIPNYPAEEFSYISMEDIKPESYFITSYGRVFTVYGKELFPDYYNSIRENNVYMRIELGCTTYYKRRKFFIHRLVAYAFIPRTDEDIKLNRDCVNHKFNKDGRCNYVWNLEWCNISENTLHGLYFNEPFDMGLFDYRFITDRRDVLLQNYSQIGQDNPKSRISEHQAMLICYAYTVLDYNPYECAIYAWLEGNEKDILLVNSIINGYAWKSVSCKYGIEGKSRNKPKRTSPIRENKKEEYDKMKENKL